MDHVRYQLGASERRAYCARHGLVDEIVKLTDLRRCLEAFTGAAYQNPTSICSRYHMLLPWIIKE